MEQKYAEKVKLQDAILKPIRYCNKSTPCRKNGIFQWYHTVIKKLAAPFLPAGHWLCPCSGLLRCYETNQPCGSSHFKIKQAWKLASHTDTINNFIGSQAQTFFTDCNPFPLSNTMLKNFLNIYCQVWVWRRLLGPNLHLRCLTKMILLLGKNSLEVLWTELLYQNTYFWGSHIREQSFWNMTTQWRSIKPFKYVEF